MNIVTALNLYPLKGARAATLNGQEIDMLDIEPEGLACLGIGDRELFIVAPSADPEEGLMVVTPRGRNSSTGRDNEHQPDRAIKTVSVDVIRHRRLALSAPNIGRLVLDLDQEPSEPSVRVALHGGRVWGFDLGPDAADFAQKVTGRPDASMMRVDRAKPRTVKTGERRITLAADGHPFTIGVDESLAHLNEQSQQAAADMRQFRPGIVVNSLGKGPFSEHLAKRIAIGPHIFEVVSGSIRCIVTNLNEGGQPAAGSGLRLLRERRGVRHDAEGNLEEGRPEPIFCVNARLESSSGETPVVARNMSVAVLDWADRPHLELRA